MGCKKNIAWYDFTDYSDSGTDRDVFYKYWNATTGIWNTTTVISTESTGDSRYTSIAVDISGNVHIAWYDYTDYGGSGGDQDIFYKYWDAATGVWNTTTIISTESTDISKRPSIAVDVSGNVHIVWGDETDYGGSGTDRDIFYKYWDAATGVWNTTTVISTESTGDSSYPSIAVEGSGNVYVAWDDLTDYGGSGIDYDVFYKRWPVELPPSTSTSSGSGGGGEGINTETINLALIFITVIIIIGAIASFSVGIYYKKKQHLVASRIEESDVQIPIETPEAETVEDPGELLEEPPMELPFKAYTGNKPYIFISYAHSDKAQVYPEMTWIKKKGFHIWYDEGIPPSSEWPEEIEKAILDCDCFIVFITPHAIESLLVRNEVNLALDQRKPFLSIFLEPADLKYGLRLRMGQLQSILKYEVNDALYQQKVAESLRLHFKEESS